MNAAPRSAGPTAPVGRPAGLGPTRRPLAAVTGWAPTVARGMALTLGGGAVVLIDFAADVLGTTISGSLTTEGGCETLGGTKPRQ